jgi:hypothetical protein
VREILLNSRHTSCSRKTKKTACGALDLGLHGCKNAGTEMSQFTDLQLVTVWEVLRYDETTERAPAQETRRWGFCQIFLFPPLYVLTRTPLAQASPLCFAAGITHFESRNDNGEL